MSERASRWGLSVSSKVVRIISALAALDPPQPSLPIGALMIAGVLERQGIEVDFVDLQLADVTPENYVDFLAEAVLAGPRVVGISVMSDGLPSVLLACQKVKRLDPGRVIVLGGPGPSTVAMPLMERFDCIDYVVVGEGEETAAELFPILVADARRDGCSGIAGIVYREGQVVRQNSGRPPIADLDALPLPAYGCAELDRYRKVYFLTARGCPYHCTFCVTSYLGGRRVRYRSAQGVVSEIKRFLQRCDAEKTALGFGDDLFPSSASHVESICTALQTEGLVLPWSCYLRVNTASPELLDLLKRTGFARVAMGIESGSDSVLRRLKKGFTAAEAARAVTLVAGRIPSVRLCYMWGFPFETTADLMQTLTFKWRVEERISPDVDLFSVWSLASPLAGSVLHEEYKGDIRIDWDLYFRCGALTRSAFVLNVGSHAGLRDLIEVNQAVFPNFFVFPHADLEAKRALMDSWRRMGTRERSRHAE